MTNCCIVSRGDSGVDSVERAEDEERLLEFALDVEPFEGDDSLTHGATEFNVPTD